MVMRKKGKAMSKIEWCDETWNPITGCTPISAGCKNCYARVMINRFGKKWGYDFTPTFHPDRLDQPSKWKEPRKVFCVSMGDLFHGDIPFLSNMPEASTLYQIFCGMRKAPQHTYMVLTKRPKNMADYIISRDSFDHFRQTIPNLWLGVTVENADNLWRVEELMKLRPYAAKLFISVEPMLGPVDLRPHLPGECYCHHCRMYFPDRSAGAVCCNCECKIDDDPHRNSCQQCGSQDWDEICPQCGNHSINGYSSFAHASVIPACDLVPTLDWVICGAETIPNGKPRPMDIQWARDLRDQCQAAGVPFFFKRGSDGSRLLDGREWNEVPE
jgi:protein gp37